jgi:type VI secretion system protein ImpH
MKYRPARAAEAATLAEPPATDPVAQALLAFTGYGTAQLLPRLAVGEAAVLHYAGLLAGAPRSAERLAALASDWLGRPVEVCQFAGAWMPLPPDERSALAAGREPGRWNQLGVDAAIGVRAWDAQARIVAALLPGEPGLHRFVSLVRAFLGLQTGFAVNLVLAGNAVPPLCLGGAAPSRLGWTSWLPRVGARADAAEAMFEAERVEEAV